METQEAPQLQPEEEAREKIGKLLETLALRCGGAALYLLRKGKVILFEGKGEFKNIPPEQLHGDMAPLKDRAADQLRFIVGKEGIDVLLITSSPVESPRAIIEELRSHLNSIMLCQEEKYDAFLNEEISRLISKRGGPWLKDAAQDVAHFLRAYRWSLRTEDGAILAEGDDESREGLLVERETIEWEDLRFEFFRTVPEMELVSPLKSARSVLRISSYLEKLEKTTTIEWVRRVLSVRDASVKGEDSIGIMASILEAAKGAGLIKDFEIVKERELLLETKKSQSKYYDIMFRASETETPQIDTGEGVIANVIRDDENERYIVALRHRWPETLRREVDYWRCIAELLNFLLPLYTTSIRIKSYRRERERLRLTVKTYMDAFNSLYKQNSMGDLIKFFTAAASLLTFGVSFAFIRRGDRYFLQDEERSVEIEEEALQKLLLEAKREGAHLYSADASDFDAIKDASERYAFVFISCIGHSTVPDWAVVTFCDAIPFMDLRKGALNTLSILLNSKAELLHKEGMAKKEEEKKREVEKLIFSLSKAETIHSALSMLSEAAANITGADYGFCSIKDMETEEVESASFSIMPAQHVSALTEEMQTLIWRMLPNMEPQLVNEVEMVAGRGIFKSFAGVPFRLDVRRKGHISVGSRYDRLTADELSDLKMLSYIAENALRGINARGEKRKLLLDFERLQQSEIKLYSSSNFKEFVSLLAVEVSELFNASTVLIVAENGGIKRIIYSTLSTVDAGAAVYNSGPIGLHFNDTPFETRIFEDVILEEEWGAKLNGQQMMAVKISNDKDVLVLVAFTRRDGRRFTSIDAKRLSQLARLASTTMSKLSLVKELYSRLRHLQIEQSIVNAMAYGKSDYDALNDIMPEINDMVGADVTLLWKYNSETDKVALCAEYYRSGISENLRGFEFSASAGIVGSVIKNRAPVLISNATNEPTKGVHIPGTNVETFESVLGIPLTAGDATLGALMLYRDSPPPFGNEELKLMDAVCRDISLLIGRYRKDGSGNAQG
jgi:hypothetical protein